MKAQNEFITIWQPGLPHTTPLINIDAPSQAAPNQIWFPGIGENYTITWEEVGFPAHNGTMTDVTSTSQVLIDFGNSLNDVTSATYRVKVSNGNGIFRQIKFGAATLIPLPDSIFPIWTIYGSADKILEIEQWGNISWESMNSAFSNCRLIQLTATDAPDLSNVTDASFMFHNAHNFLGASSMGNWDTSHIQDFSFMFAHQGDYPAAIDNFNPPSLVSWNTSAAVNFNSMFMNRKKFNQPLNTWNTSNATNMGWMFASCLEFNQRLDNWDTSKVTDMAFMFHFIPVFNQPLKNWNTSNVVNLSHMFHGCTSFNQNLDTWNVSKTMRTNSMFAGASIFNQSLASWNLAMLNDASGFLSYAGFSCENYSKSLAGWADNPNTANNVNLGFTLPLQYAANAVNKRNILIGKGWIFNGDVPGSCFLSIAEAGLRRKGSIYPNPAQDNIHIEDIHDAQSFKILDASGRIVDSGKTDSEMINVSALPKGNYILQIVSKEKIENFKFIKK
ncbi:BspA family leucine-rich repeat surface protein [Chryseobacterium daeguense]|uniref:BspA family leucine-rich repeat surface protein n=1 Tax=Chryseobacterium daeguense TaxID=412438 RepID=UPI0003F64217|nr:BspA family leucine-rich repeat surface protein [Chryseobacterium daeguense]